MTTVRWLLAAVLLGLPILCFAQAEQPEQLGSQRERFLVAVLKVRNAICTENNSNNQPVDGVCLDKHECARVRGNQLRSCAVLGSCCNIERSCGTSTHYKLTYFVSPTILEPQCSYHVDVTNRDVCQVRLDFELFSLAQPTSPNQITNNGLNKPAYLCRNDSFTVTTPTGFNNLGFLTLCGENSGQHIYVPVNASQGATSISLNFLLADRTGTNNADLPAPRWRIKVTQLECASTVYDYSTFTSTLTTLGQQHHRKNSLASNDFYRLAPPGCLQYYTERSGTYRSFNYNGGQGPYIGNLNYAICFRRYADVCGIQHTPTFFRLNFDYNDTSLSGDRRCDRQYTNTDTGTTILNNDYLFIPNGVTQALSIQNKYCDSTLSSTNYARSYAPGPLYVYFHSDDVVDITHDDENGFSIDYQLLNSGCDNNIFMPV